MPIFLWIPSVAFAFEFKKRLIELRRHTRARAHARCGARRGAKRRRSSTPAREKRSRVSGVSVPMENGLGDSRVDGSHAGGGRRKTKTTPRDVLVGGLGPGCGPGRGPGR